MTLPALDNENGLTVIDPSKMMNILPFNKDVRLTETNIAGMMFVDGVEEVVKGMKVGDRFQLRREPDNYYDSNAIAVVDGDGLRIGYIPRKVNPIAAGLMDSGKHLYCEVTGVNFDFYDQGVTVALMMEDL